MSMMNLETLESSINRRVQEKVLAERKEKLEKKGIYLEEKYRYKLEFERLAKPHKTTIIEHKAQLKELRTERFTAINKLKKQRHSDLKVLKSDYRFSCLEINAHSKSVLDRINANYKIALNEYDNAIDLHDEYQEIKRLESEADFLIKEIKRGVIEKEQREIEIKKIRAVYALKASEYNTKIVREKNKEEIKRLETERDEVLKVIGEENKRKIEAIRKAPIKEENIKKDIQAVLDNLEKNVNDINKIISEKQNQDKEVIKDEKGQFVVSFEEFYKNESEKNELERNSKIDELTSKYNEDCKLINEKFEIEKTQILEHLSANNKKILREEHKRVISDNKKRINELKLERKNKEANNKELVEEKRLSYKKQQVIANEKSKTAKLEQKKYLDKLKEEATIRSRELKEAYQKRINEANSEEQKALRQELKVEIKKAHSELEIYKKHQKIINQDYRSIRKQTMDQLEAKVFKKVNPAYLYVAPAFFGALLFTILPFIFMLLTAFMKLDLVNIGRSYFVGFGNYRSIFQDREFQLSMGNTMIYSLITVVLLTVVTIGMAAWLSKNTKIHNAVQTMVFTPHIASLVAISILWIAMLHPTGIINQVLGFFGIEGPGWLIQENTSLFSVSLVTVWKDIGYYVLIIISGLQSIPSYVYEAAKLDKAKKGTTFFKITIPLLAPTLSFVFVNKFINSFKVFAPIEIMTNGGPMGSSMVLSYWIYKVGRIGYNYGNAMAGAIILTALIAVFTFLNRRFFNKQVVY